MVEWHVSEAFTLYFWLLIFSKHLFSITNTLACFLYPSYTGLLVWQSPFKTSALSAASECQVERLNSPGLSAHFPKVCTTVTSVENFPRNLIWCSSLYFWVFCTALVIIWPILTLSLMKRGDFVTHG